MLPSQSSCELDQRCFEFIIIPGSHFFRSTHSRKEIRDAAQMLAKRVIGDGARGGHTCKFSSFRKYSIDVCVSIEFFAAPFAWEIPPLHECPSGAPDLAERAVIFDGVGRSDAV